MRALEYTVVLERNEDGGYTVNVPALKGCVTQGSTIAESLSRAREAVECHLESLATLRRRIPTDRKVVHLSTNDLSEVWVFKISVHPAVRIEKKGDVA